MKNKKEINVYNKDTVKALMILAYYDALNVFCFKTRDIFAKQWNNAVSEYDIVWDMHIQDKQPSLTYSRFIKHFGSFTKMKQILKNINYIA